MGASGSRVAFLEPLPHIDPLGFTLKTFEFALAILFGLLQPMVGALAPLLALAKYLAYINGTLALFNLIPGFPLDGGRVFRAVV